MMMIMIIVTTFIIIFFTTYTIVRREFGMGVNNSIDTPMEAIL